MSAGHHLLRHPAGLPLAELARAACCGQPGCDAATELDRGFLVL